MLPVIGEGLRKGGMRFGLGGDGQTYSQKVKSLFGSSLIGYWPLWETSGTDVLDISGNGRNGTYIATTLANLVGPFESNLAPYFDGTAYANLQSASLAAAFSGLEGTLSLLMRPAEAVPTDLTARDFARFGVNTNNRVYIQKAASNRYLYTFTCKAGATTYTVSTPNDYITSNFAGWMHVAITWSRSNGRMRAYLNGIQVGTDQAVAVDWSGALALSLLGASAATPTDPLIGWLAHVALGNAELSATAIASLANIARRGVIWEGDSRTAGTGATNINFGYAALAGMKLNGSWRVANIGASGQSVATMITQIAAEVTPKVGSYHIAVLWGGVNDNTDAATMHTRISTWCATVRALGIKVMVCTEIDCQAATHTDWHNTNYQALNALILANYATYADGVADLGADAKLQNAADTTYFNADKTHLNNAGYAVVAGIVAAAVNALG